MRLNHPPLTIPLLVAAVLLCGPGPAVAADPAPAAAISTTVPPPEKDPIRAILMDSKEKNRGVGIHTNGLTISGVVVALEEQHVIARSQQSSRIVIRLDRIDGVSTFF